MGSSLSPPGTPHRRCVAGQGTRPHPRGPRDETRCGAEPCALNRCHPPKDALAPAAAGGSWRNGPCCGSSSAPALPRPQAARPAPWQRSWLALSQGLRSMGGRPFGGSEAWEMFIAWPRRHWRAIGERRRAKAAQAAPHSRISSSKGQRRGERKSHCLQTRSSENSAFHSLKSCSRGCAGQGDRGCQGQPCCAGAEGGVAGDIGDGWGLWEPVAGRAGCGTGLCSPRSCPAAPSWVLGRGRQCQGAAHGQAGSRVTCCPAPRVPKGALRRRRGAAAPVPRAAGPELRQHTRVCQLWAASSCRGPGRAVGCRPGATPASAGASQGLPGSGAAPRSSDMATRFMPTRALQGPCVPQPRAWAAPEQRANPPGHVGKCPETCASPCLQSQR